MCPYVDIGLQSQSIDEDHDNFTEKTCVNVKTWSSFEEISDFEEVGSLESLVDKTDENCENQVQNSEKQIKRRIVLALEKEFKRNLKEWQEEKPIV